MAGTSIEERVRAELEPALAAHGVVVDELVVQAVGKRRVVRLTVDTDVATDDPDDDGTTPVAPLTLDEIADITRSVDEVLEASGVMGEQPYVLEVGSPGVGRALTDLRHYRRNVGRLVRLTLDDDAPEAAGEQLTGRIVQVGGPGTDPGAPVVIEVPATKETAARTVRLAPQKARRASVQVEFNRSAAPTGGTEEDS